MAIQMPLDNYGEGRVAPGRCHLSVSDFKEYGEPKSGSHIVECEILAHDDPEQVGKTFKDFIPDPARNAKAVFRIVEFAVATGLITRDQLKRAKEAGEAPEIEPTQSVGKQFFAVLAEEEYNGKTNTKVKDGRAYYRIDDPKAKDFPRSEGMLKRAGVNTAPANGGGNGASGGQQKPAAAAPANPFG